MRLLFRSTADALCQEGTAAFSECVAFYALCVVCVNEHQFVVGGCVFRFVLTQLDTLHKNIHVCATPSEFQ